MPRIYKLGYWREMLLEHSQDASLGYISLPQDTDAIVAGLIDNNPVPTRSVWHDYKLLELMIKMTQFYQLLLMMGMLLHTGILERLNSIIFSYKPYQMLIHPYLLMILT